MQVVRHNQQSQNRPGLAPLELVLALPLLLFVMALMINIGAAGAWKIRTQTNARHAAWRSLTPRTGNSDPRPPEWPGDAELAASGLPGTVLQGDPYQGQTVVRGPQLTGNGSSLPVDPQYLDFDSGLHAGFAEIRRRYALLATMPGDVHYERDHQILDGSRFQFWSQGLGSNNTRRVVSLYNFLLEERSPAAVQRYLDAALAVYYNPNKPYLTPLTGGDPEVFQLLGTRSPNFQPNLLNGGDWRTTSIPQVSTRIPNYCESDPSQVRVARVEPMKKDVRNMGHTLSDYYIGVYQQAISQLQMIDPQTPAIQAQIAALQDKLAQVQTFKGSLPPREP